MKDILGREIKVGDIVAHGTRSGNSGELSVKIIADIIEKKEYEWSDSLVEKCKVINFSYIDREWNRETREWEDVAPHYEKGGSGWSLGMNMLVVNESVPDEVHYFLKSLL